LGRFSHDQIHPGSGGSSSSTAWFFDKNAKAVEKNSTARHRWLPYSRPLQRLLEEAARRQLQLPEAPEAAADAEDEVEKVVEVVEVTWLWINTYTYHF
jgi:hypothetical protein